MDIRNFFAGNKTSKKKQVKQNAGSTEPSSKKESGKTKTKDTLKENKDANVTPKKHKKEKPRRSPRLTKLSDSPPPRTKKKSKTEPKKKKRLVKKADAMQDSDSDFEEASAKSQSSDESMTKEHTKPSRLKKLRKKSITPRKSKHKRKAPTPQSSDEILDGPPKYSKSKPKKRLRKRSKSKSPPKEESKKGKGKSPKRSKLILSAPIGDVEDSDSESDRERQKQKSKPKERKRLRRKRDEFEESDSGDDFDDTPKSSDAKRLKIGRPKPQPKKRTPKKEVLKPMRADSFFRNFYKKKPQKSAEKPSKSESVEPEKDVTEVKIEESQSSVARENEAATETENTSLKKPESESASKREVSSPESKKDKHSIESKEKEKSTSSTKGDVLNEEVKAKIVSKGQAEPQDVVAWTCSNCQFENERDVDRCESCKLSGWECPCGVKNKPAMSECENCHAARTKKVDSTTRLAYEWTCGSDECEFTNGEKQTQCEICGFVRHWMCSSGTCSFVNKKILEQCGKCNARRPEEWQCSSCFLTNLPEKDACSRCKNRKTPKAEKIRKRPSRAVGKDSSQSRFFSPGKKDIPKWEEVVISASPPPKEPLENVDLKKLDRSKMDEAEILLLEEQEKQEKIEVVAKRKLKFEPETKPTSEPAVETESHAKSNSKPLAKSEASKAKTVKEEVTPTAKIEKPKVVPTEKPGKTEASSSSQPKSEQSQDTPQATPKPKKWYPGMQRSGPSAPGSKIIPVGRPYCLANKRFVITGVLESMEREEAADLIKQYGGKVTGGVSGMTSYLVVGDEPGESKLRKAKEKHVETITEDELLAMIAKGKEQKPPKAGGKKGKGKPIKKAVPHHAAQVGLAGKCRGMLWVDKYKPNKLNDLIGSREHYKKITNFLKDWSKNLHKASQDKKKKSSFKRACLLSGPPGIGKSTVAAMVARDSGWDIVEMNASDTRSKKLLQDTLDKMIGNQSITQFYQTSSHKASTHKFSGKTCLIMDEVDGMSSGDRGGMQELIKLIHKTKVPIICICNDRQSPKVRSLANYCHDLRFRRPTASQVSLRLQSIAIAEGLRIDLPTIEKISESTHGDVRQMLNLLQLWAKDSSASMTYGDVNKRLGTLSKDINVGPWDVVPPLFRRPDPRRRAKFLVDRGNAYFTDPGLVPLMVQENYLHSKSYGDPRVVMDSMETAARFVSDGDLIDMKIRSTQNYSLMPMHGTISCVAPAFFAAGGVGRIQFPSWLGRNSSRGKNLRLLSELGVHTRRLTTGSPSAVGLDYVPALREKISGPLIKRKKEGIPEVLEVMGVYHLTRDDWETITTLGKFGKRTLPIEAAVKSAFTRRYNAEVHVAFGKLSTTRGSMKSISSVQKAEEEEVEEDLEEDKSEEDDIKSDKLIVSKKKPKKKAKKRSKSTKAKKPRKKRKTKK